MAPSPNALTLMQYAIMSNDPLVQAISYSLIDNGCILDDLPIVTKKTLIANGVRFEGNLPTVNWRKLNADPVVTSGTPSPFSEQLYVVSNAIDVDRLLVMDQNAITDPRAAQVEAYLKALAYDINDKFINNDHATGNADAFVGLRNRVDNPTIFGVRPENNINVNLDLTPGFTQATANAFLEYLDQMLWSLGATDGNGVVLYMNDIMKRRLTTVCRIAGLGALDITQDNYDRQIVKYRGAIVRDIGYKVDQSTRIIGNAETAGGLVTGGTQTSLYGVRYGEEYLVGWQMTDLVAQDINMIGNGGTQLRTLIDWAFGLYPSHTRCIVRARNVRVV